jgi:hypothetical protein
MIKFILRMLGVQTQLDTLKALVDGQAAQLKKYHDYSQYITVPVVSGKAVTTFLSDLAKQQVFLFYLMTVENDVMFKFRDGKDSDVYRGALRAIDKIREDLRAASAAEGKKNAEV